jgi:hypothetical protein
MVVDIGTHAGDVEFPVWDVVTDLPLARDLFGAIERENHIVGVSIVRGRPPLDQSITGPGEGIVVWSFDPAHASTYPDWAGRMAATSFAHVLSERPGESLRSATIFLEELMSTDGDPVTLSMHADAIAEVKFTVHDIGEIVVSTDPQHVLAAACFGCEGVPAFRRTNDG